MKIYFKTFLSKTLFVKILGLTAPFLYVGCLQTREDLKESEQRQTMQQQVVNLQRNSADTHSRFGEIEEDLRTLNGKIDSLQDKLRHREQNEDQEGRKQHSLEQENQHKLEVLQESVSKLETALQQIVADLEALKNSPKSSTPLSGEKKRNNEGKHGVYESAQDLFEGKEWKKAILEFQKYREENPKGSKVPNAIYKIGVSFQELAMPEEARTFYEEVIAKHPKSEDARKAKIRLKSLKK